MTLINIGNMVTFAPNLGVLVHEEALDVPKDTLIEALELAWKEMKNEHLRDACHSGTGPLAKYSELSFDDYKRVLNEIRLNEVTQEAKRRHTKLRRAEFNAKRSHLILAMIDMGIPYVCAVPGCEESTKLTVDHIVPLSRGGTDELSNLQFLCKPHNSEKSDSLTT